MNNLSIEVNNLSKSYSDHGRDLKIFENLSFGIEEGTKIAIVGASGIGKTTLLHLLGGLDRPTSGEIKISGETFNHALKENDELAKFRSTKIGFVFQFHNLLPEFTALENVAMPFIIKNGYNEEYFDRANSLLKRLGLSQRISHKPTQLSGGEQQRVAIARAFCTNPKIILADEPTGNLDRKTAEDVFLMLSELTEENNTTLVVVTHSEVLASRMDCTLELRPNSLTKKNFLNELL